MTTIKEQRQLGELSDLASKFKVAESVGKTELERATVDLLSWVVRKRREEIEDTIARRRIRKKFLARKVGQVIR